MAYEYIKQEDLNSTFKQAKTAAIPLHEPFDEFERIARNRPHPGIDKSLPRVTDGTLAALIQEQPKRVIQQIPTGKVETNDEWLGIVASYIFENEIIPNSNQVASLIQKCWALVSKTLTYGSQPAFVQFVNRGDYFGTDFTLPYVKDVYLEPGKLSDKDSNVIFLNTWWTPNQIDAIIAKEEGLYNRSVERKDKEIYQSGWNLDNLKKCKDEVKQKDVNNQTPNERNKKTNDGFIQIVHAFQRGVGAKFYSFCPSLPDDDNIVRTKVNKDPRGAIPIHFMYANVDLSNPLGRGSVEMSGGMQNLLDSEVQSYQYMRALLMNPPLEIKGDVSNTVLKYAPAAQWRLGVDPNASITPVKLETASLQSFPENYGLIKSQILNLNSSTDTSISSTIGNPGFSKTDAGVKANDVKLGISDNYMRKQFESVWEEIAETEINLYFAERAGTQILKLDADTAEKLRRIKPNAVNENNEIRVDYSTDTDKLQFQVDASTSSMKDDAAERDRLIELLDLSGKYPAFAQMMGQDGTRELINRIVVKTGVEDPEKIMPKQDGQMGPDGQPIQGQQPQQQQVTPDMVMQIVQQAMQQEKAQPKPLAESLAIKFSDLPEDSKQEVLKQLGFPTQAPSPTQQDLNIKASNSAVKVAQVHHQSQVAQVQATQDALNAQNAQQNAEASQQAAVQSDQTQQQPQQSVSPTPPATAVAQVPALDQNDLVLINELQKRGYNQKQIGEAVAMMKHGLPNDQIIKALHGPSK